MSSSTSTCSNAERDADAFAERSKSVHLEQQLVIARRKERNEESAVLFGDRHATALQHFGGERYGHTRQQLSGSGDTTGHFNSGTLLRKSGNATQKQQSHRESSHEVRNPALRKSDAWNQSYAPMTSRWRACWRVL